MKTRLATCARVGLWAGLMATAIGEITAATTRRGRSPSSGLARGLVDLAPARLVDGGVALVGQADKPGLVTIAASASAAAASAGALLAPRSALLGAATAAAPHALGGYLALRRGDASTTGTAAATAASVVIATAAVTRLRPAPRVAVAALAATAAGAVVANRRARRQYAAELQVRAKLPTPARALRPVSSGELGSPDGVAPILLEPGQFPVIDITVPEPRVDLDSWKLAVDGEVATPFAMTLGELLELPLEERDLLMICVHNPVGGDRMGCARWTGIAIDDLLIRAGVSSRDDGWLVVEAVDGYTNVLPLAEARDRAFLAVGMAGQPLPREHGSPARLLVPGRTGQDGQTKWVRRLTVTSTAPLSYWGQRGWLDGTYPVSPSARIDTPRPGARVTPGESAPPRLRLGAVGRGRLRPGADRRRRLARRRAGHRPRAQRLAAVDAVLARHHRPAPAACPVPRGQWRVARRCGDDALPQRRPWHPLRHRSRRGTRRRCPHAASRGRGADETELERSQRRRLARPSREVRAPTSRATREGPTCPSPSSGTAAATVTSRGASGSLRTPHNSSTPTSASGPYGWRAPLPVR